MSKRDEPGIATGYGEPVDGKWLWKACCGMGVPIPKQIADKLRGRTFRSFREFREAFWMEVEKDPILRKQFCPQSLGRMRNGNAPYAADTEYHGEHVTFILHHVKEIQFGGPVYDMDNIRIVTPKRHFEIHYR